MDSIYDVIITGAGPAGLTAGIYASRAKLKTLIIEMGAIGGQIALSSGVENYPGASVSDIESGAEIAGRMRAQALHFGAEIIDKEITEAVLSPEIKEIICSDGSIFRTKSVIIASGAYARPIGCENEDAFVGSGISYCATCDGNFFAGLDVYVVGGGDSALEEAVYLSKIARKVTVIHRRDSFRASKYIQEKAAAVPNISFIMDTVVKAAVGEDVLEGLKLRNVRTGDETVIEADPDDGMIGLFGFTGMIPRSGIYEAAGVETENGYIKAGEDTHTNIPGVFAAGDIRTKKLRQVVTACADGAVAATEADKYVSGL